MNIKRKQISHRVSFPFNAERLTYFYSGRNALWHAIKVLKLTSGSEVLLPSYNCGAEIDPFVKRGIRVKLYKVDANLKIDFQHLYENITPRTKAILITHYFGFPQPVDEVRKLCDERNLYLIEDCAHSLLSTYKDKPLGLWGDISIFSFKKLLPVPDGGAIVINNHNLQQPESILPPPFRYALNNLIIKMLFRNRAMAAVLSSISKRLRRAHPSLSGVTCPYDYRLDIDRINWGMSKISDISIKNIIGGGDIDKITSKRCHNFVLLLHNLRNIPNINLMFYDLPEGVCPTVFPIIVKSRDKLYESLLNRGIFTFKTWQSFYPDLPWHHFPHAMYLKNRMISFPLLKSMNEKDMRHVLKILRECG